MKKVVIASVFVSSVALAGPVLQMNKAFNALSSLVPFITEKEQFMKKSNQKVITEKLTEVRNAFRSAKHEDLLKQDLFAPSYQLVNDSLDESLKSLNAGAKDYAHWRLKELTALCLDCHTRLPTTHDSSFTLGELSVDAAKYTNTYNLGIAQLIVRRYADAKTTFTKAIDEKLVKNEFKDLIDPFKQILLIDAKILKNPSDMSIFVKHYLGKKQLPDSVRSDLLSWEKSLKAWEGKKIPKTGLKSDAEIKKFISNNVSPIKEKASFDADYDVDMLLISGILSNYLFENPSTTLAPELNYWIGWSEKYLKRENFFGSGDLFLKQCIKRYPSHPMAAKCLAEYKDSIEFEFSGSSGTHIPQEVQKELKSLETLLETEGKKKRP